MLCLGSFLRHGGRIPAVQITLTLILNMTAVVDILPVELFFREIYLYVYARDPIYIVFHRTSNNSLLELFGRPMIYMEGQLSRLRPVHAFHVHRAVGSALPLLADVHRNLRTHALALSATEENGNNK